MKKINQLLAYCAVFALILAGCSKDEPGNVQDPGNSEIAVLELGPVLVDLDNSRQQITPDETPECVGDTPAYARLRLEYGSGNTEIVTNVDITSDSDGNLFTKYSEELEIPIPSGETTVSVTLTDFVVYNDNDMVIWVAPKEDSEFEDFVTNPLDNEWLLRAGSKNYQEVEVICFDDREVNNYGYQFFDITPIPLIKFCVFGNYCPPSGRHYVAAYRVNVYESDNGDKGDLIWSRERLVEGEGNDAYADPLCFELPNRLDIDDNEEQYYFEFILLPDTPGYDGGEELFAEGPITVAEIELFFGENGTLDYYHFQYGCDGGVPPPFGRPETKRYKACIKYLDSEDEVAGFAYLSLNGTVLEAATSVFGLKFGEQHPQHIHQNASCSDPGGITIALDDANGDFPIPINVNGASFINYYEIIPNVFDQNLQDRTIVIHGKDDANGDYQELAPVACGEFEEY
ncbi:hypothetical protein GCM10023115_48040 [Pontixanthobacter gangjinensis]|uniref:Superoxide dismutase family protein n=1 Tax=Christiangramia aestuarii TaxID=1028746 RepID=A0A7M3SWX4_9FLAO|nr:hypothetical protein [Christiangramia aestuarii]MUP41105.1 superoxide dismutase family protein [Christiangramia aestuarii]